MRPPSKSGTRSGNLFFSDSLIARMPGVETVVSCWAKAAGTQTKDLVCRASSFGSLSLTSLTISSAVFLDRRFGKIDVDRDAGNHGQDGQDGRRRSQVFDVHVHPSLFIVCPESLYQNGCFFSSPGGDSPTRRRRWTMSLKLIVLPGI